MDWFVGGTHIMSNGILIMILQLLKLYSRGVYLEYNLYQDVLNNQLNQSSDMSK